jgi:large subunit ribosomal protein L32
VPHPPNLFEDLMAVPKRRMSKSRKRLRRGHDAAASVRTQACPRCSSPKLSHRVCESCGYYRGKKQIEVEDA